MPAGDRTGPRGMGPRTGRGAGYCAGYSAPGYANAVPGRGYGMGWGRGMAWGGWGPGRGRGWRHRYYAPGLPGWARFGCAPGWGDPPPGPYGPYGGAAGPSPEQEGDFLRAQAQWLQEQLEAITGRLDELEQEA
jgi:hypothetical protein